MEFIVPSFLNQLVKLKNTKDYKSKVEEKELRDSGFWVDGSIQYVFYLEDDIIMLFPSRKNDMYGEFNHSETDRYEITLTGNPGVRGFISDYTASIISTNRLANGAFELKAKYVLKTWEGSLADGFDLFGEAVDDFIQLDFNSKERVSKAGGLFQAEEIALDQWELNYHGIPVTVQLLYMNTTSNNDGRDRREYHPVFRVLLQGNEKISVLLQVYEAMLNFIRLWRYRYPCGNIHAKLITRGEGGNVYRIGALADYGHQGEQFKRRYVILPYEKIQLYLSGLLNIAFESDDLQLDYLPVSSYRSFRNEYDPMKISKLYTAFERECNHKAELYNRADSSKIDTIKQRILDEVDSVDLSESSEEEREFVRNVKSDIKSKGKEYGQKRKLAAAFEYLYPVLHESVSGIIACYDGDAELRKEKAKDLLIKIPALRGKTVHSGLIGAISEEEARALDLLELMVYAQILKRFDFSDEAIQEIISIAFEHYCGNFTYIVPD